MIGECFGNVRSTPTPKLTLRTVNVSRTPLPLIRMTTPWNTCTRSRVPSTTRTCTLRVSPGPKSGMSVRRWARSTRSVAFIGILRHDASAALPQAGSDAGERFGQPPILLPFSEWLLVEQPLLVVGERPVEQVGPAIEGPAERLASAPPRDAGVVTRPQHLGNGEAPELGGARVLRVLEQS